MLLPVSLHEIRALVAACLFLVLASAGCTEDTPESGTSQPSRIVYGLTRQPAGFDPHLHRSVINDISSRQVYDTLLYRHPISRELVAGLAREWFISPDGLSLTLQLREDVRFHDGSTFNAAAVAINLARIFAPENTGACR